MLTAVLAIYQTCLFLSYQTQHYLIYPSRTWNGHAHTHNTLGMEINDIRRLRRHIIPTKPQIPDILAPRFDQTDLFLSLPKRHLPIHACYMHTICVLLDTTTYLVVWLHRSEILAAPFVCVCSCAYPYASISQTFVANGRYGYTCRIACFNRNTRDILV